MCTQTRPWFILTSERISREWSPNQVISKGSITQDRRPNTLPTEQFRPPSRSTVGSKEVSLLLVFNAQPTGIKDSPYGIKGGYSKHIACSVHKKEIIKKKSQTTEIIFPECTIVI